LTTKQRSILRAKGNVLKATINIGKLGLSDNLLAEIDTWLYNNEIVKIAMLKSSPLDVKNAVEQICSAINCECVSIVGGKAVLYKYSDKQDIEHIL